jgi:hypothetical protein
MSGELTQRSRQRGCSIFDILDDVHGDNEPEEAS